MRKGNNFDRRRHRLPRGSTVVFHETESFRIYTLFFLGCEDGFNCKSVNPVKQMLLLFLHMSRISTKSNGQNRMLYSLLSCCHGYKTLIKLKLNGIGYHVIIARWL
jgi:hypothetical protein